LIAREVSKRVPSMRDTGRPVAQVECRNADRFPREKLVSCGQVCCDCNVKDFPADTRRLRCSVATMRAQEVLLEGSLATAGGGKDRACSVKSSIALLCNSYSTRLTRVSLSMADGPQVRELEKPGRPAVSLWRVPGGVLSRCCSSVSPLRYRQRRPRYGTEYRRWPKQRQSRLGVGNCVARQHVSPRGSPVRKYARPG
jgi:hypothetical protein